jgi:pimeloyl-ACP methyl ester carboxylesterase
LFAFEHPDKVAALMLVDPSHEDQLDRLPRRQAGLQTRLYVSRRAAKNRRCR